MNKYESLWKWIQENGTDSLKLTFDEIEKIAGLPIDHSFLNSKKELLWIFASGITVLDLRKHFIQMPVMMIKNWC